MKKESIKINCSLEYANALAKSELECRTGKLTTEEDGHLEPAITPGDIWFEVDTEDDKDSNPLYQFLNPEIKYTIKLMSHHSEYPIRVWKKVHTQNLTEYLDNFVDQDKDFAICSIIVDNKDYKD